ncbi:hypothetical protein F5887DRAFT_590 [Amanita rubescens]|nr:hypothetical protein F5887DRAFT_590 [Amanita rubescens]
MSRSAPKINAQPSRSAWSKGPPQSWSAPSRSESPPPSGTQPQPTRVPVKDGVSVLRNSVGAVNQGAPVTFGSIDDVSAPISPSPASTPQVKSEGVKSFGSLPNTHVNGEASRSTADPSPSSTSIPAAATPSKPKVDIRRFFQHSSSQPPTPSTPNDASSPARPSPLPSHASSNQSTQSPPTPSSYPFFTHYPYPQQQDTTSPSNGPPRSPAYSPNPNVLLLRHGERNPVAVIKGESLSGIEEVARQRFNCPPEAQLRFHAKIDDNDELVEVDAVVWPHMRQFITCLWIEAEGETSQHICNCSQSKAQSEPLIRIFVITWTGWTIGIKINLSATVGTLKAMIQSEQDIPPYQQRLRFRGDDMDDDETLESYNVVFFLAKIPVLTVTIR